MGGGSSKSNTDSTTKTEFAQTSQNNPFYETSTDKEGNTTSKFKPGTAGETAYNFVNQNISGLLNDYLNPSLNSTVNKAKMADFQKTQNANLQNNIINPLANNNMIRSSQATNMYNNLSNQSADYANQLISDSHNDTWNMINNLLNLYTAAYQGTASEENTSINSSLGTGTTTTKSNSSGK
jgi:hypothetical protein